MSRYGSRDTTSSSTHGCETRHQQADRLAHVSPLIFDALASNGSGYQTHAGAVTACLCQGNAGYIHAGNHRTEAQCTKCGGQIVSCARKFSELSNAPALVPICAHENNELKLRK